MQISRWVLLLGIASWTTQAAAQDFDPGRYYGGITANYLLPDSRRDADRGLGGQLLLGLPLRQSVWAEFNTFAHSVKRESTGSSDTSFGGGIDLVLATTERRLRPFVLLGGGAISERFPGTDKRDTSPYLNAGFGIQYWLNPRWALRSDARYYVRFTDRATPSGNVAEDVHFGIGLQYGWGAPEPPPAPAPALGPPAVVPPAPPLPPPLTPSPERAPLFSDSITFAFDSSQLDSAAMAALRRLADEMLRQQSDLLVHIVGHADWIGTDSYNLTLSRHRARAVRSHLLSQLRSLTSEPLIIDFELEGRGAFEPAASNDTEEGRQRNRRADVTVYER